MGGGGERGRDSKHTLVGSGLSFSVCFPPYCVVLTQQANHEDRSKYHRHVFESVGLLTACMSLSQSQGMKQMTRQDSQVAHTRNLKTDPQNLSLKRLKPTPPLCPTQRIQAKHCNRTVVETRLLQNQLPTAQKPRIRLAQTLRLQFNTVCVSRQCSLEHTCTWTNLPSAPIVPLQNKKH